MPSSCNLNSLVRFHRLSTRLHGRWKEWWKHWLVADPGVLCARRQKLKTGKAAPMAELSKHYMMGKKCQHSSGSTVGKLYSNMTGKHVKVMWVDTTVGVKTALTSQNMRTCGQSRWREQISKRLVIPAKEWYQLQRVLTFASKLTPCLNTSSLCMGILKSCASSTKLYLVTPGIALMTAD